MASKRARPKAGPPGRLAKAIAEASTFAAALPPPNQSSRRNVRVLVALSDQERATIAEVAEARGEPLATTVRTLAVTYAEKILEQSPGGPAKPEKRSR
jgi:hypothetical protein